MGLYHRNFFLYDYVGCIYIISKAFLAVHSPFKSGLQILRYQINVNFTNLTQKQNVSIYIYML